jgi:Domain of unknown function (DUF5753)/Caspase domain
MNVRLADPAHSRIVLVGTPSHLHADERLPDVPAVANNIADLATAFTDPDLGGFDAQHCITTPATAGLAELGEILTDAAAQAKDLLLVYYAGHGLLDRRGQLYLALAGTHPDRLGFTALPYETLRAVFLDSDAASKVLILDSCFSGRAIGQVLADREQQVLEQLEVNGTYTLTSAPANRSAVILPGERHTAFTGRLLELLREGDPGAGPVLSMGGIYRRLRARLMTDSLPMPQQRGTSTADLLGLVRNRRAVGWATDNVDERIAVAERVRAHGVQLIPWFLQCPEYVRAVVHTSRFQSVEELDRLVEERMRRQDVLSRETGPQLHTVIDESALRRPIRGMGPLQAQLEYLIEKAEQPNTSIQLLPFSVGARAAETGTFTLLRFSRAELPDVVYLEQLTGAQYLDRYEDVEKYTHVMDRAMVDALTPEDTLKALKQFALLSRRTR